MPGLTMSLSGKTEIGMQSLAGEKVFSSSLKDVFWTSNQFFRDTRMKIAEIQL